MLEAMAGDAFVMSGQVRTGWNEPRRLTWNEFCGFHEINGDRFKCALEALMDLETCISSSPGGAPTLLRDSPYGAELESSNDNVVWQVDMLVGGSEDRTVGKVYTLWVSCAMYLARHLDYPMPACMRPVREQD